MHTTIYIHIYIFSKLKTDIPLCQTIKNFFLLFSIAKRAVTLLERRLQRRKINYRTIFMNLTIIKDVNSPNNKAFIIYERLIFHKGINQ